MSLYLRDAQWIDWRTGEQVTGHLRVDPGPRGGVVFVDEIPPEVDTLDCRGRWVTRAFAVAHHHIYSTLARGMPPPARSPSSFVELLELIWWKLDRALDPAMIRASARACAIDAIRSGTTFIVDHHASPHAVGGSLEIIAEALEEAGLGHLLCYELSDRDGVGVRREGLEETARYLEHRPGLVGLHASFTVSDALLRAAVELAGRAGTGLHLHVAEAESDQTHCLQHHGQRVVERLQEAGALESPRTLLAHCLHLDDHERALVAESPVWVVQNPESNLNNAVGRFDPRGLGGRILIGTDGMHSDALASARAAFLTGQPGVTGMEIYSRLRAVHGWLEAAHIPGDGENNLLILDYDPPTPLEAGNWLGHLFYGLSRAHVESVVAQGRLVMHQRRLLSMDEEEIMIEARAQARRLWARL